MWACPLMWVWDSPFTPSTSTYLAIRRITGVSTTANVSSIIGTCSHESNDKSTGENVINHATGKQNYLLHESGNET